MAQQYLQHISGQGEKWALHRNYTQANSHPEATVYVVDNKTPGCPDLRLPRSEYVLCEPPVVWKDVTAECGIDDRGAVMHHGRLTITANGYRRSKALIDPGYPRKRQWVIIIEQKVE